jgi:MFS family permease
MSRLTSVTSDTFRSLGVRNFRLWFVGQTISLVGYYGQTVALSLLVLELTGSGTVLGLVAALQYLPIVIFSPWAGVLSDRYDKRRLLLVTQLALLLTALVMGVAVVGGWVTVAWLVILVVASGTAFAFDQPSRRTFVVELVGTDDVANAVSLNGAVNNGAKILGPLVAGAIVAVWGIGWCFVVNAVTSIAVVVALAWMDRSAMRTTAPVPRRPGQLREGIRYGWAHREIRSAMALLAFAAALSFNWAVLLPLLATQTFGGSAGTYAALLAAMNVGSVGGTLWLARRRSVRLRLLGVACVMLGTALAGMAVAPGLITASAAAVAVGAASMLLVNAVVVQIQLAAAPAMRGRVVGVFSMVMFGAVGVGNQVSGWIAERHGARVGLAVSAVAALVVGAVTVSPRATKTDRRRSAAPRAVPAPPHNRGRSRGSLARRRCRTARAGHPSGSAGPRRQPPETAS